MNSRDYHKPDNGVYKEQVRHTVDRYRNHVEAFNPTRTRIFYLATIYDPPTIASASKSVPFFCPSARPVAFSSH